MAVRNIWWVSSDSRNTNNEYRQSSNIKKIHQYPSYYALLMESKALHNNISTTKTSSLEQQNSLCSTGIAMFYNLIK